MTCSNFPGGLIPFGNGPDAFNRVKQAVQQIADAMCTGCIAHLESSVLQDDYLEQGFGSTVLEICDVLRVYITNGNNEIYEAVVLDPDAVDPEDRITTWFLMHTDSETDGTITAEIRMYAKAAGSPPSGWLFCDGQAVSRTTYSTLFAVIGTLYGVGNGSTTFNLPDLRAKVPMGTNDAGLPNGANGSFTTRNEGATGGTETHTLVQNELAAHLHTVQSSNALSGATSTIQSVATASTFINRNSSSVGTDTPHNNVQPFVVVNYIIKT